MRFRLYVKDMHGYPEVVVTFESSKERVELGTLKFVDNDGENRPEIRQLLLAILKGEEPMIEVVKV